MAINLVREAIKSGVETNGRVMLTTKDTCITINRCPTTELFEIEGKHTEPKMNMGLAYAQTLDYAIGLAQSYITKHQQEILKII